MNSLLFVYGTLRKHEKNHHLLAQSACINEQARTKGSLFAAKEGPTAVLNGEGYIYGEVYEADELCIHKLDQFFQGYHKQTVFVETDVGIKNALIYFMNKDGFAGFTKISSGDWKEHQMISKSKNPIYYFAYGSCMDNARFQKAGVDHYFQDTVGRAVLKGYTTRFTLKGMTVQERTCWKTEEQQKAFYTVSLILLSPIYIKGRASNLLRIGRHL